MECSVNLGQQVIAPYIQTQRDVLQSRCYTQREFASKILSPFGRHGRFLKRSYRRIPFFVKRCALGQ